ncbi:WYL domain-containing protein [Jonesiaceae bacterium BS-20]|uniref:WYL domain-containing protein n=1 Tax=Jonesiaceae bacterium BS-20 TaxID=3120821 RepID=A0AAU7DZC4_9MICO
MSTSISSEERLLNLVIALMNTTSYMTRAQIVATVAGYDQSAAVTAQERMFERDKVTLRNLGLPLVTIDRAGHASEIGYRIDKDSYGLGEFNFTPAQFSVLSLAATLWKENTALAADSTQALTKLRSGHLGQTDTDALAGLAPRLRDSTGISEQLIDAISLRRTIAFDYRAAHSGELARRNVAPWRVAVRGGAWYLIGFDLDRDAPRVFRFSRFESKITTVKKAAPYEIPQDLDVDRLLGIHAQPVAQKTATIALRTDRAQSLRLRGTQVASDPRLAEYEIFTLPYQHVGRLSEELAGYGDAVLVMEPAELRGAVIARLRAVVALAPPESVTSPDQSATSTSQEA